MFQSIIVLILEENMGKGEDKGESSAAVEMRWSRIR
jgi:hypothetical protein